MNRFKTLRFVQVVLLTLLSANVVAAGPEQDLSAGRAAAQLWVAKLDADQFGECWDLFSSAFKKSNSRWAWNIECRMGRLHLGKARSRKEVSAERTTTSPGGRTGEFVIIKFATTSEKKGPIFEQVAVQKDVDGQWRVCGYAIGQEQK